MNRFIADNGVSTAVELGCGDGNQLARLHVDRFLGLDVSASALDLARARMADQPRFEFFLYDPAEFDTVLVEYRAPLALSMDVIYHLVEDDVFDRYMDHLFDLAERWVIIYSSDFDLRTSSHVRHRHFTSWIAENRPSAHLVQEIPNPFPFDPATPDETSHASFFVYETRSLDESQ